MSNKSTFLAFSAIAAMHMQEYSMFNANSLTMPSYTNSFGHHRKYNKKVEHNGLMHSQKKQAAARTKAKRANKARNKQRHK